MSDVVRRELENLIIRKRRQIKSTLAEQTGLEKEADKLSVERLVLESEVEQLDAHLLDYGATPESKLKPTTAPAAMTDDFVLQYPIPYLPN